MNVPATWPDDVSKRVLYSRTGVMAGPARGKEAWMRPERVRM